MKRLTAAVAALGIICAGCSSSQSTSETEPSTSPAPTTTVTTSSAPTATTTSSSTTSLPEEAFDIESTMVPLGEAISGFDVQRSLLGSGYSPLTARSTAQTNGAVVDALTADPSSICAVEDAFHFAIVSRIDEISLAACEFSDSSAAQQFEAVLADSLSAPFELERAEPATATETDRLPGWRTFDLRITVGEAQQPSVQLTSIATIGARVFIVQTGISPAIERTVDLHDTVVAAQNDYLDDQGITESTPGTGRLELDRRRTLASFLPDRTRVEAAVGDPEELDLRIGAPWGHTTIVESVALSITADATRHLWVLRHFATEADATGYLRSVGGTPSDDPAEVTIDGRPGVAHQIGTTVATVTVFAADPTSAPSELTSQQRETATSQLEAWTTEELADYRADAESPETVPASSTALLDIIGEDLDAQVLGVQPYQTGGLPAGGVSIEISGDPDAGSLRISPADEDALLATFQLPELYEVNDWVAGTVTSDGFNNRSIYTRDVYIRSAGQYSVAFIRTGDTRPGPELSIPAPIEKAVDNLAAADSEVDPLGASQARVLHVIDSTFTLPPLGLPSLFGPMESTFWEWEHWGATSADDDAAERYRLIPSSPRSGDNHTVIQVARYDSAQAAAEQVERLTADGSVTPVPNAQNGGIVTDGSTASFVTSTGEWVWQLDRFEPGRDRDGNSLSAEQVVTVWAEQWSNAIARAAL